MGFWAILGAIAKGAAAAGSKAIALAGKGAAMAGKAAAAAGKGAMAIGKAGASAAKFTGSKAIGLAKNVGNVAKDVGQGIMGKPTANVQIGSGNMANVLVKPNLAQNVGGVMRNMGKEVGTMLKSQVQGQVKEQTGFDFGNKGNSSVASANQTPNKSIMDNMNEMQTSAGKMLNPERPPQGEFEDIAPIDAISGDVGNIQGAPMGVTEKQPLPLSQLSPADIEYYKRMRMQQGGY